MGSSAPPKQITIEPGTRLDRYELLCMLAHGGMANVWLARLQGKMGFQKLFAIKTILPNVADDVTFKTMFLDEARIASRIDHPNVVHMIDVGESGGVPYLVMDLIEGEPLYKLLRACEKLEQRIPLGVVLRIMADACHGLHAAHELCDVDGSLLNVVHRDMSPQNILISAAGVSKVIDFGVAKARDRNGQTTVGTLKGKLSYMPREQALGQDVDRRTDTWALGAVLYFLLAGRPPYKGEQQLATLQLAMSGAPIPPLPNTFPSPLRMLVTRSLAPEPAQRFQTAAEMGEAIEMLMRRMGVVTTHAEVSAFVHKALGERLEARRQLVAAALSAADTREQSRNDLSIPIDTDANEAGSHNHALVAVPSAVTSTTQIELLGQARSSPSDSGESSTGATRAAFVAAAPGGVAKRSLLAFAAGAAALALMGIVLIVLSFRTAAPAKVAAAAAPVASVATAAPAETVAPKTQREVEEAKAEEPAVSASASASAKPAVPAWTTLAKPTASAGAKATPPPKKKEDYGF